MKKFNQFIDKMIPSYSRVLLLIILMFNFTAYIGSRFITAGKKHYSMDISLDQQIPLLPWMVVIYLGCYIFWAVNYILATRFDKREAYRFAAAELIGKGICLFFFIFLPTTMQRPEITGHSIWEMLLQVVYQVDAADNLFPSVHCLVSWYCYIGIRKNEKIPKWYKIFSLIFALMVCVSTVTVKQHVLVDVFAGVMIAEVCYYLTGLAFDRSHAEVKKSATQSQKKINKSYVQE